ncbi:hypothetical protein FORC48_3457 [Bacillus cereus]|nr:hypothetical protein FORC48_3457 [Bacillus cereus]AVR33284.1 hypothetical protein FORC60_3454 [Bacillus cereus]
MGISKYIYNYFLFNSKKRTPSQLDKVLVFIFIGNSQFNLASFR